QARHAGDHPLPAAFGLHRARPHSCPGRRPHRGGRRQGIGAGAGSQGLRTYCRASRMTLALNLDRKAQAAAVVHSHGVPHRRIEEWKYSDLKSALGEKGLGAVMAEWLVGNLPAGVDVFDLSQPNPPAWVMAHVARPTRNVMSAASLALSAG